MLAAAAQRLRARVRVAGPRRTVPVGLCLAKASPARFGPCLLCLAGLCQAESTLGRPPGDGSYMKPRPSRRSTVTGNLTPA